MSNKFRRFVEWMFYNPKTVSGKIKYGVLIIYLVGVIVTTWIQPPFKSDGLRIFNNYSIWAMMILMHVAIYFDLPSRLKYYLKAFALLWLILVFVVLAFSFFQLI